MPIRGQGFAIGISPQVQESAHRQRHQVVGGIVRIGSGLAEGRDAGHDQAGVDLLEIVIAQAAPFHEACRFGLDQDVRVAGEFAQQRLSLGLIEIQAHAALALVEVRKGQAAFGVRALLQEWTLAPCRGAARRFHEHHVGAHLRQHPAAVLRRVTA
ncbi:hypothetical protein D3C71_1367430 [compost metagenome]